jgi:hypothetical protein
VKETNAEGLIAGYSLLAASVTETSLSLPGGEQTLVLFNAYEQDTGSLILRKTFTGVPEGADVTGLNFRVTGPDGYENNISYAAFESGIYTLTGLPLGVYTVTETNANTIIEGYVLADGSVWTAEAEIAEKDGGAEISLTNNYEPQSGALLIAKTFTGLNPTDNVDHLTFRILGPDGYDRTVRYGDFTNGFFLLENLTVGSYVVYETNATSLAANLTLLPGSVTAVRAKVRTGVQTTARLTNNYENANTQIGVIKVWNDMDNLDGSRPASLTVTLSNGRETVTTVTLTAENSWSAEVTDLPIYDEAGRTINYTWTETVPAGYTLTSQLTLGNATVLTNTHTPELTSATVTKVWDDSNNAAGLRPAILRVTLSNGRTYVLSASNNWTVTVNDLPKYYAGQPVHYTWSEQSVLGYTQTNAVTVGEVTTFTNTYRLPLPPTPGNPGKPYITIDDYGTPLGINVMINHVGDCFD